MFTQNFAKISNSPGIFQFSQLKTMTSSWKREPRGIFFCCCCVGRICCEYTQRRQTGNMRLSRGPGIPLIFTIYIFIDNLWPKLKLTTLYHNKFSYNRLHSLPTHVHKLHSLPTHVNKLHSLPTHVHKLHSLPTHVHKLHSLPTHVHKFFTCWFSTWGKKF